MAVKGGSADSDDFGDGVHGVFVTCVHLLGDGEFVGCKRWRSSSNTASGSGSGKSRPCSVSDEVAFELCERTEQMEDELATGCGCVDVLCE